MKEEKRRVTILIDDLLYARICKYRFRKEFSFRNEAIVALLEKALDDDDNDCTNKPECK